MKLAAHYNKASIIISVSVLLISAVVYYLTINHIARQQLNTDLSEEVEEVIEYVNHNHQLPKPVDFDEDITTFAKTTVATYDTHFFDTPYVDVKENKTEEGRAVSALVKVNGQNYIVTIIESRENTEYLITIITVITLVLTAVLLTILIITNRYVLNGLWRPFYQILSEVKWFNVSDIRKITTIKTKVDEFNELSDAVSTMASRVTSDYQGLKTFTENASHEMMTPLAVITSKLDMLIQDETLRSDQFVQINDIYSAANKLSRLNQSLLLLIKIDNNLLDDIDQINIRQVIDEKAQQFQELVKNKNIIINSDVEDLEVEASKYLIDVLINNLFSNAVRHNKISGEIRITLSGSKLSFRNSGDPIPLNENKIFERFYKGKISEGTGLGLAIMKNICGLYNFELKYSFTDSMHYFEIDF